MKTLRGAAEIQLLGERQKLPHLLQIHYRSPFKLNTGMVSEFEKTVLDDISLNRA